MIRKEKLYPGLLFALAVLVVILTYIPGSLYGSACDWFAQHVSIAETMRLFHRRVYLCCFAVLSPFEENEGFRRGGAFGRRAVSVRRMLLSDTSADHVHQLYAISAGSLAMRAALS